MSQELGNSKEPTSDDVREAKLCERCSILRFDDKAFGGYESEDEDGRPILKIREEDRENVTWGYLKSRYHAPDRRCAYLLLDFNLLDTLPHLPELEKSADSGCEFCGILRSAILRKYADCDGRVEIETLAYFWSNENGPEVLVAYARSEGPDQHMEEIDFAIEAPGSFHLVDRFGNFQSDN
jgi:hypothetical protein